MSVRKERPQPPNGKPTSRLSLGCITQQSFVPALHQISNVYAAIVLIFFPEPSHSKDPANERLITDRNSKLAAFNPNIQPIYSRG